MKLTPCESRFNLVSTHYNTGYLQLLQGTVFRPAILAVSVLLAAGNAACYNSFIVRATVSDPIEVHVPIVPAYVVWSSFTASTESHITVDVFGTTAHKSEDLTISPKGSFWWSRPDLVTFVPGL